MTKDNKIIVYLTPIQYKALDKIHDLINSDIYSNSFQVDETNLKNEEWTDDDLNNHLGDIINNCSAHLDVWSDVHSLGAQDGSPK